MATDSPYATEKYEEAFSVAVEITWPDGRVERDQLRLNIDQWTQLWGAGIPQGDTRSYWSQQGAERVAAIAQPFYDANPTYETAKVRVYARPGRSS